MEWLLMKSSGWFRTKKPLPFGSLGVHKKKEFNEANEAFFIFDCLYYNGESLLREYSTIGCSAAILPVLCPLDKTLKERREILTEHMATIENRILLSDMKLITKKNDLKQLINYTIAEGLEGLVLKVNPSLTPMTQLLPSHVESRWRLRTEQTALVEGEEGLSDGRNDGRHRGLSGPGWLLWDRQKRWPDERVLARLLRSENGSVVHCVSALDVEEIWRLDWS